MVVQKLKYPMLGFYFPEVIAVSLVVTGTMILQVGTYLGKSLSEPWQEKFTGFLVWGEYFESLG